MLNALALYYPYISVPDGSWLRTSLLLWEQIAVIVPKQAQPSPLHVSHQLRENRLLRFIDPSDYLHDFSSQRFFKDFKRLLRRQEIKQYLESDGECMTRLHENSLTRPEANVIHSTKLSHDIITYLVKRRGARSHGDWIECDTRLCDVYMAYLASHIKDYWGANPLTNIDYLENLLDIVENSRTPKPSRRHFVSVVSQIEAEMPSLPPDFPIDELIKLRSKYSRPYETFRRAFIKLRCKLNRAEDEESADEITQAFRWDLDTSLSEMSDFAHEQKLDLMHASLQTVFSVTGAAAAMLLASDPTKVVGPLGAAVTLAYGFGKELRKLRLGREKAIRENDFSYLFLIGRDVKLKPSNK